MEKFSTREILERHIQQLDAALKEKHTVEELVKLSDALERAITTYEQLGN